MLDLCFTIAKRLRACAGFENCRSKESRNLLTDVLLSAADAPYHAIQAGKRDLLGEFRIRHLTVEKNSNYMVRYTVKGNLWVEDGSEIGHNTQTGGLGSRELNKNTVARFCGGRRPDKRGKTVPEWLASSHWVSIDTSD